MTPEGKVKAKVKRALKELCAAKHWLFMPVQTGYGADALDFLGCVNGFFVAIETKANKTKKLTARQMTTAENITAAGGFVFVVFDDTSLARAMHHIRKLLRR